MRPTIAVTMGDPAGIGPEIVLGALKDGEIYQRCRPVVIGSLEILRRCAKAVSLEPRLTPVSSPSEPHGEPETIEVLDVSVPGLEDLRPGEVQVCAGLASDAFIRKACEFGLQKEIVAIVTAPISKESLRAAGIKGIGHTELLAEYLLSPDPLTLFITDNMRIFFLSRHLSLRQAIEYITENGLVDVIARVHSAMRNLGFPKPSIAVSALNPHASDGGQFGQEEETTISPAIRKARRQGIEVVGPIPADSVFHQALEGRFDCVISLYHDQGHIAVKTRDFYGTVTATLGLPVLRTSVDHGTAFDIAWQGKANPFSMKKAVLVACDLLNRQATA